MLCISKSVRTQEQYVHSRRLQILHPETVVSPSHWGVVVAQKGAMVLRKNFELKFLYYQILVSVPCHQGTLESSSFPCSIPLWLSKHISIVLCKK